MPQVSLPLNGVLRTWEIFCCKESLKVVGGFYTYKTWMGKWKVYSLHCLHRVNVDMGSFEDVIRVVNNTRSPEMAHMSYQNLVRMKYFMYTDFY